MMNAVERRMEKFARALDRRTVLRGAAVGIFAGVTAVLVGPATRAAADGTCPNSSETAACDPPNGVYCTSYSSTYCSGASCTGGCTINKHWYPGNGCWCTKVTSVNGCYNSWYKCCDCSCPGGRVCGCRQQYTDRLSSVQQPNC